MPACTTPRSPAIPASSLRRSSRPAYSRRTGTTRNGPKRSCSTPAIVLAVKPIEGVEQERFGPFRVVPVRREYAGREERLSNDAGIAGLLGVVQAGIEGAAGVVPATEFHQRVAAAEQGEGAHRRIGRGLGEFGIEVGRLRPLQAPLFLDAFMERRLERLQVHRR